MKNNKCKLVVAVVATMTIASVIAGVIYKLRMNAVEKELKALDLADEDDEEEEFEDWNDEYFN